MRFSARKREFYLAAIRVSGEFEAEIRLESRYFSAVQMACPFADVSSALRFKHFEGKLNSRVD